MTYEAPRDSRQHLRSTYIGSHTPALRLCHSYHRPLALLVEEANSDQDDQKPQWCHKPSQNSLVSLELCQ